MQSCLLHQCITRTDKYHHRPIRHLLERLRHVIAAKEESARGVETRSAIMYHPDGKRRMQHFPLISTKLVAEEHRSSFRGEIRSKRSLGVLHWRAPPCVIRRIEFCLNVTPERALEWKSILSPSKRAVKWNLFFAFYQ